jgi:uncharacterized protein (DUF2345 family)
MTSTTVDALKNLYVALGGTASDVADLNVIPDVINAIAGLGAIKASGNLSTDEDDNLIISSGNEIHINAENGQLLLVSSDKVDISSENNGVNITADEGDIDIISTNSAITIDARGADLNLKGDAVIANGKAL